MSLTEPGTIAQVSVQTSKAATVEIVAVETERGSLLDLPPASDEAEQHEIQVMGLPTYSDIELEVRATAGSRSCSCTFTTETEGLSVLVPAPELVAGDAVYGEGGWIAATVITEDALYPAVFATDGTLVWASGTNGGLRTLINHARTHVLFNQPASEIGEEGEVTAAGLTGGDAIGIRAQSLHTDFVELPRGGFAALQWEVLEVEGRELLSSNLLELDSDGSITELWSAEDSFSHGAQIDYDDAPEGGQSYPDLLAWTHVNSVSYSEFDDAFYLTEAFDHAVARVTREGEATWVLGGHQSTFDLDPPDFIRSPHSARYVDEDELLVFSRGEVFNDEVDACAWVSHVRLDRDARVATELSRYEGRECNRVPFFGEATPLEDGTFILWSSAGRMEEIDEDLETRFLLELGLGAAFAYGQRFESFYPE